MAKRKKSDGVFYLDLTESENFLVRMTRDYHEKVREAAENSLIEVAEYVQEAVTNATRNQYLPAKGKYATGRTFDAVNENNNFYDTEYVNGVLSVPVGFPKDVPNAGAYLINGTNPRGSPRRAPAKWLHEIFGKRYMNERRKHLERLITEYLERTNKE